MTALIAGLDEVGMGALSGPLVVAVVAFPETKTRIAGVTDSKKLSWQKLNELSPIILKEAAFAGWGYASARTINEVGLAEAWHQAAMMALLGAPEFKEFIIDGDRYIREYEGPQQALPKADITHWQVSAASIVAKVLRDTEMMELHLHFPQYGWDSNAGYGTKVHKEGLIAHGPCPFHRLRFVEKLLSPKVKKERKPSRF